MSSRDRSAKGSRDRINKTRPKPRSSSVTYLDVEEPDDPQRKPKKSSSKHKHRSSEEKVSAKGSKSPSASSSQRSLKQKSSQYVSSKLPVIPSRAQKYTPILYTFRIPVSPKNNQEVKDGLARSPPFYLQLDHTLAVIWCLFCTKKMKKPLGIAQLQWALIFLKGIRDNDGEHPKDVTVCIQAIEDELIDQYASMVEDVKGEKDDVGGCASFCKKMCHSKNSKDESQKEEDATDSTNPLIDSSFVEEPTEEKTLPFSVNYAEMVTSTPIKVEQLYRAADNMREEFAYIAGQKMDDRCVNRDEMNKFLQAWRKEQINKIESELKRLHSIENFMKNVEDENFKPYLDEQQLDALVKAKTSKNK